MPNITLERLAYLQERCDDRSVMDDLMLPKDEVQVLIQLARRSLETVVWEREVRIKRTTVWGETHLSFIAVGFNQTGGLYNVTIRGTE